MKKLSLVLLISLLSVPFVANAQQVELSASKGYPSELEWVFHAEIDQVKHEDRNAIHYTLIYTRKGSFVSEMFRDYRHISQEAKNRFTVFNKERAGWQSTFNSITIHRFDRTTQSLPNDSFSKQFPEDFLIWQSSEVAAIIYYNNDKVVYAWVEKTYQKEVEQFVRNILKTSH